MAKKSKKFSAFKQRLAKIGGQVSAKISQVKATSTTDGGGGFDNSVNFDKNQSLENQAKFNKSQAPENQARLDKSQIKELALIAFFAKKYTRKLLAENALQNKARPLQSTLSRLENFLKDLGVELIDYEGAKFNDGMNVEIIDTIKIPNADTSKPIATLENLANAPLNIAENSANASNADTKAPTTPFVSECIEPSIIYQNQLLHKARIIKAISDEDLQNLNANSGENSQNINQNLQENSQNQNLNSSETNPQNTSISTNSQTPNLNEKNSRETNENSQNSSTNSGKTSENSQENSQNPNLSEKNSQNSNNANENLQENPKNS